jgi:hypothetical protein
LEDIRDELEFMQYERELRNAYGGNQQVRPQAQPNQSVDSSMGSLGYSKIFKNSNVSVYVKDSSISNVGTNKSPMIIFTYRYVFSKPQYNDGKTYFSVISTANISCNLSMIRSAGLIALDRSDNKVFSTDSINRKVFGIEEELKKYVCP